MRYCGRDFTGEEIAAIRRIIAEDSSRTRSRISRLVCEEISWLKPNGELKEMSCRVALLRMEKDGLLTLPPPRKRHTNGRHRPQRTGEALPGAPVTMPAGELVDLQIEIVRGRNKESALWNEYIDRYHYLGYTPLPGAQIRYLARALGQVVALISFSASAWKAEPRDTFIGWTHEERERNVQKVVNNSRFLILPWIRSRHLASRLLGMTARRIGEDWEERYAYRPVLLETFVEVDRFEGTCYRAANWIPLGLTTGRGKASNSRRPNRSLKQVWGYPLEKQFRQLLAE